MEEVKDNPTGRALNRIFVGGLGVTVTASDLEQTFSSLGKVMGVEIVRTNGRSFAYMDFQPASEKALGKLFSMYNGCVWKGGRLKLEKAKEHYLARLRREWAEDVELAKDKPEDSVSSVGSLKKSKDPIPEKMQLQIFFPRIKKVKSLPYSGTGKHKYSFQRVEVPSLPIHFCDCEEHCKPSETPGREHLSTFDTQIAEINDQELKIMNSVMSKLFEREATTKAVDSQIASHDYDCLNDSHVPYSESEADQSIEADNLVTNITMQRNSCRLGLMQTEGWGKTLTDQEYAPSRLKASGDEPAKKPSKSQGRQKSRPSNASETTSDKKPHLLPADERAKDELPPISPKTKRKKIHHAEPESSAEAQPIQKQPKTGTDQLADGLAWVQKSSWKQLVGGTGNGSFSISQILPTPASTKQKSSKLNDSDIMNSSGKQLNLAKNVKFQSSKDHSKTSEVANQATQKNTVNTSNVSCVEPLETKENQAGLQGGQSVPKDDLQITNNTVFGIFNEPERKGSQEQRTTMAAFGSSETCTFMRSANSEREWKKARAALSGSLKKKANENNNPTGRSNRKF
eukprot:TRINITY_DN4892_c0_g1_i1.p1 TRINITY_DN4892_c0_g1~~TRINITY_DN4892_c0_g1_i1.p1  ORF type:complete len:570 (-),score=122.73 TRINITY_DN4892_c0_g1_i1:175-1884(-)